MELILILFTNYIKYDIILLQRQIVMTCIHLRGVWTILDCLRLVKEEKG
jgi:hypothetical protein